LTTYQYDAAQRSQWALQNRPLMGASKPATVTGQNSHVSTSEALSC
jgi:hypothetical protein